MYASLFHFTLSAPPGVHPLSQLSDGLVFYSLALHWSWKMDGTIKESAKKDGGGGVWHLNNTLS